MHEARKRSAKYKNLFIISALDETYSSLAALDEP